MANRPACKADPKQPGKGKCTRKQGHPMPHRNWFGFEWGDQFSETKDQLDAIARMEAATTMERAGMFPLRSEGKRHG